MEGTENVESVNETKTDRKPHRKERRRKHGSTEIKNADNDSKTACTAVTVHGTEVLLGYPALLHQPVVEVHVCDLSSGFYVNCKGRTLLSRTTNPATYSSRNLSCMWQETFQFEVALEQLTGEDPECILFFQIKDGIRNRATNPESVVKGNADSGKEFQNDSSETYLTSRKSFINRIIHKNSGDDWKTLAWAFLKLRNSTGYVNTGDRLRLQLFQPRKHSNVKLSDLYSWWKSCFRSKYSSTLYVSIKHQRDLVLNDKLLSSESKLSANEEKSDANTQATLEVLKEEHVRWTRLPYAPCRIPDEICKNIDIEAPGCLCIRFCNKGLRLACGVHKSLRIFSVVSGKCLMELNGHLGLIYDICWSNSNKAIVTSSSDATARIWHFGSRTTFAMLVHPSFVYVSRFLPNNNNYVCTGCYDHIVRVWYSSTNQQWATIQEVNVHYGFISAMCFSKDGATMYTGDEKGVIHVWNTNSEDTNGDETTSTAISSVKEIRLEDVTGKVINCLLSHPGGHRLVVHTRDSSIRLINHKYWKVTHMLAGPLNICEQTRCCVSPCGRWVFAGGEDSRMLVWDSDTGELATEITSALPYMGTVSCIDFHPYEHMMAVSSYDIECHAPVLIMTAGKASPLAVQPVEQSCASGVCLPEADLHANAYANWQKVGRSLLTKLDVVLKMAGEDNLQFSNKGSSET